MRKTIILLMLLLLLSSAYALEVYLRPPRMIARINLSETNVWHGFIEVKNSNNYTVFVSFKPVGDIVDKISIAEKIQLKPGELRQENFTLKVDKAGRYDGGVIVTYEKEGEVPVALQAEIIVLATGERKNQTPYLYFIIPLLLVLLVIVLKKFAKIFLIALLILPLAEGANIALVVKNASNLDYVHEYRIHRILKDMGHDVILIDANNYQSYDFNTFSAIVIAGRPSNVYAHQYLDDFVATLPVNSKPTIAIDSTYPDDFGWIYPGAIGSVFSSNIIYLNVIDNSTMLAGFPIGSRIRSHIINNYPVLNLEITRSVLTPAATLVSSNQYAVIAYAEAGTVLINNNITSARVVFFGVTQPLYWTDEVEIAFKNSVNWLLNGEFVVPT
ncbi:MAG: hypothetical protein N3E38_03305, partial [Candidatus Aenigmarchaeota archaeon]|nr:hypothetical protein [Candidatus Aenigmarchaeota archaeon]